MADTEESTVESLTFQPSSDMIQQTLKHPQAERAYNSPKKRHIDSVIDDWLPVAKIRRTEQEDAGYAASVESESGENIIIHHPKPRFWRSQRLKNLYEFGNLDYNKTHTPDITRDDTPDSNKKVLTWMNDTPLPTRVYRRRNCHSDSSMKIPRNANTVIDAPPGLLRRTAPPNLESVLPVLPVLPAPRSPSTEMSDINIGDNDSTTMSWSYSDSGSEASSDPLDTGHLYRDMNFASNGIFLRLPNEPFPEHITALVNMIRKDRDLFPWQMTPDPNLMVLEMGVAKSDVVNYFGSHVFPYTLLSGTMKRSDAQEIFSFTVPYTGSVHEVSVPKPDMLYGYDLRYLTGTFSADELSVLCSTEGALTVNTQNLVCLYFLIEVTADGASDCGSLWHSTNKCLGGSAACVNVAEQVNDQLRQFRDTRQLQIDSACFSIAMNGTEARLYITWKDGELFRMQKVESFLLQRQSDFEQFQKFVWNIVEWGRERRFKQFQSALCYLLEQWKEIK